MNQIFQYLANFGLGAVFAGVMFIVYRETVKQMRDDRKYMQDCMKDMVDRYDETLKENTKATIDNTKIQSELLIWLQARNGHH